MNDWIDVIKSAKLPKLVAGAHENPNTQIARMPRRAVYQPPSFDDYTPGNGPQTTVITFKTEPVGEVQLCAMEMVAFMEGEAHSDRPECVCPTLATIMRECNDNLSDTDRDVLMPYLSMCVGTRHDGLGYARRVLYERLCIEMSFTPVFAWRPIIAGFLEKLFAIGAPSAGFTKPERIAELEALA